MPAVSLKWARDAADLLEEAFEIEGDAAAVAAPMDFREFIGKVNPRFKWSEMSERLVALLQRVADGELKRLMVFMPPRHGKSELVSRLFSAYYLYRWPDRYVGLNSYAAELAYTFSRAARANFRDGGGEISEESWAVKHWETRGGGGMWAAGVGGPITGKGFSLGLIDDPLKNHEEASSEAVRKGHKDWYDSTFYTRAEEDAAIVVLQTRWHEDDLSGWLLSREEESPENWHIVSLEAIKGETVPSFPPTCTVEPDWRRVGEPLNPVRMSLARLQKISQTIRNYFWLALYQQRPRPADGDMFKEAWFQRYDRVPSEFEQIVVSVDCNFKSTKSGSFVVIQLWGMIGPNFYLVHQMRDRMGFVETRTKIRDMVDWSVELLGVRPHAVLVEDKANGPAIMDELRSEIAGLIPINPGKSSKEARAEAVSSYYEGGNVWLPEQPIAPFIVKDYLDEFLAFPNAATDDQVDASSQLISWVIGRRRHQIHRPPIVRRRY